MASLSDHIGKMVESIYLSVVFPDQWNSTLQKMFETMGRTQGCLERLDRRDMSFTVIGNAGYDSQFYTEEQELNFLEHDLWSAEFLKREPEEFVIGSNYVPPRVMNQSVLYNEILRPAGIEAADLNAAVEINGSTVLTTLSIYRGYNDESFSSFEVDLLKFLWPHVKNALILSEYFADLRDDVSFSNYVGGMSGHAVALLSEGGRLVRCNQEMENLVGPNGPFRISNGIIQAIEPSERRFLDGAIKSASIASISEGGYTARPVAVHGGDRTQRYIVNIAPYVSESYQAEKKETKEVPITILTVSTSDRLVLERSRLLAQAFSLTHSERQLLDALASSQTLSAIAIATGKSVETLRSQLKSIFKKTSTHSQIELMRLLMTMPMI